MIERSAKQSCHHLSSTSPLHSSLEVYTHKCFFNSICLDDSVVVPERQAPGCAFLLPFHVHFLEALISSPSCTNPCPSGLFRTTHATQMSPSHPNTDSPRLPPIQHPQPATSSVFSSPSEDILGSYGAIKRRKLTLIGRSTSAPFTLSQSDRSSNRRSHQYWFDDWSWQCPREVSLLSTGVVDICC